MFGGESRTLQCWTVQCWTVQCWTVQCWTLQCWTLQCWTLQCWTLQLSYSGATLLWRKRSALGRQAGNATGSSQLRLLLGDELVASSPGALLVGGKGVGTEDTKVDVLEEMVHSHDVEKIPILVLEATRTGIAPALVQRHGRRDVHLDKLPHQADGLVHRPTNRSPSSPRNFASNTRTTTANSNGNAYTNRLRPPRSCTYARKPEGSDRLVGFGCRLDPTGFLANTDCCDAAILTYFGTDEFGYMIPSVCVFRWMPRIDGWELLFDRDLYCLTARQLGPHNFDQGGAIWTRNFPDLTGFCPFGIIDTFRHRQGKCRYNIFHTRIRVVRGRRRGLGRGLSGPSVAQFLDTVGGQYGGIIFPELSKRPAWRITIQVRVRLVGEDPDEERVAHHGMYCKGVPG
eukprot:1195591-Prorocentrum_minimum.AAC.6